MRIELGSAQSHLCIDGKHAAMKVPQHLTSQPRTEPGGLFHAVPFDFKNANFHFLQADRRDKESLCTHGSRPCCQLRVTLAESQGKKASFLREAVRTLQLSTEVWADRVEAMPASRRFDAVTLRAVDNMEQALETARSRVAAKGLLVSFTSYAPPDSAHPAAESIPLPGASNSVLTIERL